MNWSKTQLGYFLDRKTWDIAVNLLNYQISQFQEKNPFKTLSMFCYSKYKIDNEFFSEDYFNNVVASNRFYGLKYRYKIVSYLVPKKILGYRNYKFMTYPMRAIYYSLGLYLLKISSDFINHYVKRNSRIKSFYGGNLEIRNEKLVLNTRTINYYSHYKSFCKTVLSNMDRFSTPQSIALYFDYKSYYDSIPIERLLRLLHGIVEPSIQQKLKFDESTIKQFVFLFSYINLKSTGIPQFENDLISDFLGYLYGTFGDLAIDDLLLKSSIINNFQIIRYVDDTYIFIDFKGHIEREEQGLFVDDFLKNLVFKLHSYLDLEINSQKSRIFHLNKQEDRDQLRSQLKSTSKDFTMKGLKMIDEEDPNSIVEDLIETVRQIKHYSYESKFEFTLSFGETMNSIYDEEVSNLLSKKENLTRLEDIFESFNFDNIAHFPKQLILIITKSEKIKLQFEKYLNAKEIKNPLDANIFIEYFVQSKFQKTLYFDKIESLPAYKDVHKLITTHAKLDKDTGYFNLDLVHINSLPNKINYLEQTRYRVYAEEYENYSAALNHLLNELHALCFLLDKNAKRIKEYTSNSVQQYLDAIKVDNEVKIQIGNLFNRRNINPISHPGDESDHYLPVDKPEYLRYEGFVSRCINAIVLSSFIIPEGSSA
ncbi:AbiA family abortive infection protein [Leptospira licerasiae]|uniref:AbiA family abortive infection protein n=1 Tax=Leptospira licerasiae TaxID=447106 RepID=UPI001083E130|nr:AbiA family abortive infection protein [Leptospira licerasiae]TGM88726.1 AbiA family abortive infection protein [Leptospira licerasiae]